MREQHSLLPPKNWIEPVSKILTRRLAKLFTEFI
ncbi:MAG: hypothetical protein DSY42_00605 [Aquifex sp.]|nr:MAG: hypothetical protein DSY42_00605 [Aquifex sp.]